LILSHEERSRIAKQNRDKGYRVEYDDYRKWRDQNIFALKIPHRLQKGDWSTFDVVVCKPTGTEMHQCKYRYDLLSKLERENHIRMCAVFGLIPVLCWRDRGLKYEIL
jgi:hypothetical protein